MSLPRTKHLVSFTIVMLAVAGLFVGYAVYTNNNNADRATTVVEEGTVEHAIAVTGRIVSEQTGQLSFPISDTVTSVAVREGDTVATGDTLATLETDAISEELREAQGALREAMANQREILAGPTTESRQVIETNVRIAEEQLARTRAEAERQVENARRVLLSTDLIADPVDEEERTPAPTISGTYRCEADGQYQFRVFRSNAESGFSIRVSGLEDDTIPVSFTQAVPFGDCGLRARFSESVHFNRTEWTVAVPNTASSQYIANQNALESAELEADNAITAAEEALHLAIEQRDRDTAPTRSEQREQADARIAQIESRIAGLEKRRANHTLRAPFSGVVTDVSIRSGETVSGSPVITVLGADDTYELEARIPEVDINTIDTEQTARIYFDAAPDEPVLGTVRYISPVPREIDGVAYFHARIEIPDQPRWLRPGLNADIDIITNSYTDVLRIPTSYLKQEEDGATVYIPAGDQRQEIAVTVPFIGTDGYAVVEGLTAGDTVIRP